MAYNAIEEYKANASGASWDEIQGANIDNQNPASVEFWNGYLKSSVRFHSYYLLSNPTDLITPPASQTHETLSEQGLSLL